MEQKCVIGIDVGTSGCKLLAVDDKGRILDSVVEEYPLSAPVASADFKLSHCCGGIFGPDARHGSAG